MNPAASPRKLTATQQTVLWHIGQGNFAMRVAGGNFTDASGRLLNRFAVEVLLRHGVLVDADDALFPDTPSQTIHIRLPEGTS